jgi:hypothetical protein
MCLRRAPGKYITGAMAPVGAALDRAAVDHHVIFIFSIVRTSDLTNINMSFRFMLRLLSLFLREARQSPLVGTSATGGPRG